MRSCWALLLLLGSCGGEAPAAAEPPSKAAGEPAAPASQTFPRANVLLITIDTVRADRMGCYGYERPTTPSLDALAARSVLFEQAFSASSFTPPAHGSILTGLYPAEHGLLHWNKSLADVATAADAFSAAGYFTLAVTPLETLLIIGLTRGFQQTEAPAYSTRKDGSYDLADADEINAAALGYLLRKGDQRPFFAWLHYYDAHRPYGRQGPEWSGRFTTADIPAVGATEGWYQLTPEKRKALRVDSAREQLIEDHYDGGLAYLDDRLGKLFAKLDEAGRLQDTIVLVVADHGECFDEHEPEWFAHDPYLYDENVHVPLLLRLPGDAHAGRRVKDLVSQVDLLPTLLELTGVAPLEKQRFAGKSLAAALDGRSLKRSVVFADRQGDDLSMQRDGKPTTKQVQASRDRLHMLRTPTRKLLVGIDSGSERLFDLTSPQRETQDIGPTDRQGLEVALQAYFEWLNSLQARGETGSVLSPEQEQFIRSLGYGGSTPKSAPKPPPEDEQKDDKKDEP